MSVYLAYLLIFLLGAVPFLEILVVIPLGVVAGMPTVPVTIFAFVGNILTVWLLILMMEQVQRWIGRRNEKKRKELSEKKTKRASTIWKKYGLPGLSILSPILVGSHLGVILAMSFGGGKRQITIWMTLSIAVWSIVIGVASYFGIDYLFERTGREGLLVDLLKIE